MPQPRRILPPMSIATRLASMVSRRPAAALRTAVVLGACSALAAAPLAAQAPRANRTLVSINPLGLPFKWVSAELEQKATALVTVGASFSYIDLFDDASYLSFDGKLRVYPNEEAFRGFSLGLSAGLVRVAEEYSTRDDRSETAPALGVVADYNWILGKSRRVLVGTGVGAKRIFGDDDDFSDVNFAYPTFRFQVGMIF